MRIIVFFDLPTNTLRQQREYRRFRKLLINEGFIMMQESVYSKLALNMSVADSIRGKIYKQSVKEGIVQVLVVTEKQYANIELLTGDNPTSPINDTDRLVIL